MRIVRLECSHYAPIIFDADRVVWIGDRDMWDIKVVFDMGAEMYVSEEYLPGANSTERIDAMREIVWPDNA